MPGSGGLAWGGAMLSKYHGDFHPDGPGLYLLLHRPATAAGCSSRAPTSRWRSRSAVFSPVLDLERPAWLGVVPVSGGRAVGRLGAPPGLSGWPSAGPGEVPVPLDLGTAGRGPGTRLAALAAHPWVRSGSGSAWPASPWRIHAVACFRPVLPHWGLIGLVSLFPMLGRNWAERLEDRPRPPGGRLATYACLSLAFLAFTLVEFRHRLVSAWWDGPRGLIDARSDPTLDLYGWDQVADQIRRLGLVDDPGSFVFTRYWYQSAQLAYALGGDRPALCYNSDDPRGFAFWSRPEDWIGRDGVLVGGRRARGDRPLLRPLVREGRAGLRILGRAERQSRCGASAFIAVLHSASRTLSPGRARRSWLGIRRMNSKRRVGETPAFRKHPTGTRTRSLGPEPSILGR